MKCKIVADSSCDLNEHLSNELDITLVPLTIYIDGREYVDDADMDVSGMIDDMKASENAPKTASPAPHDFMKAYEGEESTFVVTLSSKLSGTFSSAMTAKKMFVEEKVNKFIHVFDSVSASVAETLISIKIKDLIKENLGELEIVEQVEKYIKEMKTMFLLESLENLIKAGRINKVVGRVATALSIKPIMGNTDDGEIKIVEKTRGYKKAFNRLVEIIGEVGDNLEDKVLGISHCDCLKRAELFKEEVMKRYNFKDVIIVKMKGLSSVYANEGGIIIAF